MESPELFYEIQLVFLVLICVAFLYADWLLARKQEGEQAESATYNHNHNEHTATGKSGREWVKSLRRKYLVVYGIVMGADWLQGPYLYSLYREQYAFPERVVALFFVTGFLSAGIAAPMVGSWADQHGRKKLCLLFCISYTLSCACITIPILPVLLLGRVLGGTSTSILFSVFETWLVSEATSASLPHEDLSTIMGRATLINGFAATSAGVASYQLVKVTDNFAAPFMASGTLLLFAWVVIKALWNENYGSVTPPKEDILQLARLRKAWSIVCTGMYPILLVLGLTQTCFEGSMYLFVFLWVPSLQESSSTPQLLPLGYIFSSFMICMMLGSVLYTAIITRYRQRRSQHEHHDILSSGTRLHAQFSSIVSALSAIFLGGSVALSEERGRFWAFCMFEVCVGMYYPVQGTLRAGLVPNAHRATLCSLFRVPLNMFVVISLLAGVSEARTAVLVACAGMLTVSSLLTAVVIGGRDEGHRFVDRHSHTT